MSIREVIALNIPGLRLEGTCKGVTCVSREVGSLECTELFSAVIPIAIDTCLLLISGQTSVKQV